MSFSACELQEGSKNGLIRAILQRAVFQPAGPLLGVGGTMSENQQASEWYIARGDKKYGPVQIEIWKRGLDTGILLPSDRVWSPGPSDWVRLSDVALANASGGKHQSLNSVEE